MQTRQAKIMGILNITQNSFYDGGKYFSLKDAVKRGIKMCHEGADMIDIGGESRRPKSHPIEVNEELKRVIPVIKALKKEVSIPLSIDTMKPRVAAKAIKAGANFINDVSGFRDSEMVRVAVDTAVPICVMHMRGTPKTMQINPFYERGILTHLLQWFEERVNFLCGAGIKKNHITLDPGIGFGKTVDDNLKILQNLQAFKAKGFPLLLGLSRKSFMGKIVNKDASRKLLSATIAMNTIGLMAGIDIIRVHDVAEHRDVVDLITQLV